MKISKGFVFAAALVLFVAASLPLSDAAISGAAVAQETSMLWSDPGAVEMRDLTWGPGGPNRSPKPPFTFIEEDLDGTSPKIEVEDSAGVKWKVKFGEEVNAELFATRLVWAVGYCVEDTYFVRSGKIDGVSGLQRAARYVGRDGTFANARFEIREKGVKRLKDDKSWSWKKNPFVGTHELDGLKIMVMLLSNWDSKDADETGEESNTVILRTPQSDGSVQMRYVISDWGGSMGKWGGVGNRNKWDCQDFTRQNVKFAVRVGSGIEWGYSSIKGRADKIVEGVELDDVAWLMQYLGRVTDKQLRAGLEASGANPTEVDCFAAALRGRVSILSRLAGGQALLQRAHSGRSREDHRQ
jgi:hypothetical protein